MIELDDVDLLIERLEARFSTVTDGARAAIDISNGNCTNDCTYVCTNSCTGKACGG